MTFTDTQIHNITKLANAAAALLESTGIATGSRATSAAESLAERLCQIAQQMATTQLTAGPVTSEAEQAIRNYWKANQGEVQTMLLAATPSETGDPSSWGKERIQARMDEIVNITGGGDEEWMRPLNDEFAYLRGCLAVLDNPGAFHHDCPLDEPAVIETLRTEAEPVDSPSRPTEKWFEATPLGHAKHLASQLDLSGIRLNLTPEQRAFAEQHGLVIVYGASDDLMEFDGAFRDEVSALNGTIALVDEHGLVKAGREEPVGQHRSIQAHWCSDHRDGHGFDWWFQTDIPRTSFRMMDGEDKYCLGIVFALADLK